MSILDIREGFDGWVAAMGMGTLAEFMSEPVGELLDSGRNGRELRRVRATCQGQSRTFYLKRIGREPFLKLLQALLLGHRPHSGPCREWLMLVRLKEAGFETMRPVAYGERRFLGWPVGAFLLVEEVAGTEVADFYSRCSCGERQRLVEEIGVYLGALHRRGFFQPVRLKDLFFNRGAGFGEDAFTFVLIDRETSKPWPTRFSRSRCLQTVVRATRRTLRGRVCVWPQ
ncbi:MAG: lipopolysaccharide kinase InaA family protein [Syntrophotaleaceae bacterium]